MGEWKESKIGEYVDSIAETYKFKPNEQVVFLNTSDILLGRVINHELQDSAGLPGQAKKKIKKRDLLFSEIRPANGRYAMIDFDAENYVVSTKLMVLRCNDKIDGNFFKIFLTSKEQLKYLQMIAEDRSGTFPQITFDHIYNLDIFLPPLPEQRAIASVLSSLDDKIDLFHRQNKTLEAMAETLFRQWFIEEAREDWEERPLSFYGNVVCGKTPSKKKKEYFNGDIPFIKIPDMRGNTFVFQTSDSLSEEGRNSQSNKTLPTKSICVSCIATVGLVSMTVKESQTNQQINSIVPYKDYYRYYLYLFMKNFTDLLTAMASGGTATLNLNTGNFSKIKVLLPDENILKECHKVIEPLFDKIFNNQKQIRTLEQMRDTLLPKLMSGEVRCSWRV